MDPILSSVQKHVRKDDINSSLPCLAMGISLGNGFGGFYDATKQKKGYIAPTE